MASPAVATVSLLIAAVTTVIGVAIFIRGLTHIFRTITKGAAEQGRWSHPLKRLWTAFRVTISHSTFRGRPFVTAAHWLVMVSFVVLFLTLVAAYGNLYDPLYNLPLIGQVPAWNWLVETFASLGFLSIVTLFIVRTATNLQAKRTGKPRSSRFFGSTRWQAWFVEGVVGLVSLAVLVGHALQYALLTNLAGQPLERGNFPITSWVGEPMAALSPLALANAIVIVAAFKIVVSMAWLTVVGFDVSMGVSWHRFLAPINIMAGAHADGAKTLGALSLPLVKGLPSANLEVALENIENQSEGSSDEVVLGLGMTSDLTWKDRLDVLSCTECGRCQELCPAWNTGKPLSPKLLTLALRDNAVAASGAMALGQQMPNTHDVLGALAAAKITGEEGVAATNSLLVPDVTAAEVLWDCTMCGACVDQCPVDIEHIDRISNLRRFQVLMESAFPRELAKPFRAMETKGNPYNQPARKRLEWAKDLDFDVPVIGEDVEDATGFDYLFWVGCAGAYDEKAKKTSAAVAELLHTAGVTFGVLGSGESCTGDPARRAGNEVLFQMLAANAIETLNEAKATRIVVTCAHCFNTIANEYPDFDGHFEVIHHTQLLNRLMRDKLLVPVPPEDGDRQVVTYHDPCFLGRHNKIYSPPRELLGAMPALEAVEMTQNMEQAMCCGAGGARAWMEETRGERIASVRVDQAVATGATTVATACPFCTQMLDSAVPSATPIEIKDVSVLILEGVRRGQEGNRLRQ